MINKKSFCSENKDKFDRAVLLEKYKIDTALFIFCHQNLEEIIDINKLEEFYVFINASNENICYIYDKKFVIALSPLGGPAAGGLMEELGFMGIKNFFACGSAGQIDQSKDSSEFVLVDKAIRGEGASYYYLKPSKYVETDNMLTEFVVKFLEKENYKYNKSNTWTTDSFYRETAGEIELRKKQGAICVEMECATWAAIAKFRGYNFAQLLYFSDAVKQEGWKWHPTKEELKKKIINLMIDCLNEFVCQN